MTTPAPARPDARRNALEYLWGQYKVWDETSESHRRSLARWRPAVLLTGVAGAVLGALSTPGAVPAAWTAAFEHWAKPPASFGVVGGVLLGLAAFFTREMLSPERESRLMRARAAAEAFKRESFLMAAKAPPYDGEITPASLDRAKDILASTGGMEEVPLAGEKRRERMPRAPMPVEAYVAARLDEQMNYYRSKAGRHRRVVRLVGYATVLLGALAVVLGYLGGPSGVWLAVITSVSASLAAYLYARRLQYLVVSYLAAARNLEALRATWGTSGKTDADTADRNQFILDCEKILSAENTAWIAEWVRKDSAPTEAEAQPPTRPAPGRAGENGEARPAGAARTPAAGSE
ncbi:MAG TPA: SLATT domain-containing protein [Pyrinomonadaceae bacterium]